MSTIEPIGIYGALLATALAVIQFHQWHKSREVLTFKIYDKPSSFPAHIDATITNITPHIIYLEFVGLGYSYRAFHSPWRTRFLDIQGMKQSKDGFLSGEGAEGPLKPGQTMEVYFEKASFAQITKPRRANGFAISLCVWVDHSRNDKIFRKVIS